jgi:ABC-type branched-subunit amino acid transport system substrate-binding protein
MGRSRVRLREVGRGHARLSGVAAVVAAVTLAAGVAACSSTSSSPSASASTPGKSAYQLDSIIDLTGNDAESGVAQQAGMKYFLQQLNAVGGIDGHPVTVKYCDATSTPQGAAQCAQQFAGNNLHLVIAQTDDPPTRGALPYLTKDIVLSVDPVLLPTTSQANVFQTAGSSATIAEALVSAVKKSGLHTIGVVYTTDTSGTHQLAAAQTAAKAAGLTVVSQPQTDGATDVTPQLLQLKSAGAQVIYVASVGANSAAVVSSYKTLGLTMPIVVGAADVTNSFLRSLSSGVPAKLYGTSQYVGSTAGLPAAVQKAWAQYRADFKKDEKQPADTQTTSAIYIGCVAEAALKSSKTFSLTEMEHFLQTNTITCLGAQQKYGTIPGLNVIAGQPTAVTKAGATAADGWGPYTGKM